MQSRYCELQDLVFLSARPDELFLTSGGFHSPEQVGTNQLIGSDALRLRMGIAVRYCGASEKSRSYDAIRADACRANVRLSCPDPTTSGRSCVKLPRRPVLLLNELELAS
jgi:hypothetical protein